MKKVIVIFLLLFAYCSNPSEPEIKGIFYSDINKELFPYELTAEVTTYTDTTFDVQGIYRIMELPEVKLFFSSNKITLNNGAEFITSTNKEFTDTLHKRLLYAGAFGFGNNPGEIYRVKIKDETVKKIYIRMRERMDERKIYFVVGINL